MNNEKDNERRKKQYKVMNNVSDIEKRCEEVDPKALFGASALGFPDKISPVRAGMATKHGAYQRVVLTNPEFPYVFTGAENVFGERSSWNVTASDDYQIMKIFRKFKDFPKYSPTAYIYLNKATGKYGCAVIKPVEHLTEKYGFRIRNLISDKREGDTIPAGAPISQTHSYINGNYCGGRNLRLAYAVLPELTEDALVISDYAAEALRFDMVDIVTVDINKNAYLRNNYGENGAYKPFPDIGEEIKNDIICSIRENSFVSSVAEASIPHINDKNRYSHGIIVDIDIYTNIEVENEQFNYYLNQIRDWYTDIYSYISKIITDPYQDDSSLLDIYHKAEKFLNKAKWVTKEYIADTVMKFTVLQPKDIHVGQKVTGRYGNKSVVAQIIPRHLMPKTDDGRPIDVLANGLAVPNRIIGFAPYECSMTFMQERMHQHLKKMAENGETQDNIVSLAIDFIGQFNPEQSQDIARMYQENPIGLFNDIINNGLYIMIQPLNDVCVRDALIACYEKWPDIMKRYDIYTKLRHRWVKLDGTYAVGYQYTWVLKQEPSKYLTTVSTGRTTLYDLPVKTKQYKDNLKHYSDNPIKFGEYDTYNFLAGVNVRAYAKISTYFRGSQYEENSILMSQLNDMKIDLSKYNKFPQLDNLHNCLKLLGVKLKPNVFGYNSLGLIDEEEEVLIANVPVKISIPDLGYVLMMHSYYTQYEQYLRGAVDMTDFLTKIKGTNLFEEKPDWYISRVFDEFVHLLPILQQLKQYC